MLTLADPWLAAALASDAPAEVVVDWLQDQNATSADLALLYAGSFPDHDDGVGRSVLALWLQVQGLLTSALAVRQVRRNDNLWYETYVQPRIRPPVAPVGLITRSHEEAERRADLVCLRDCKRRVLALLDAPFFGLLFSQTIEVDDWTARLELSEHSPSREDHARLLMERIRSIQRGGTISVFSDKMRQRTTFTAHCKPSQLIAPEEPPPPPAFPVHWFAGL